MSGFKIVCELGNVAYYEPNNFDDALSLLEKLEEILKSKRDLIDVYMAQVKSRKELMQVSKRKFKDPAHMDKINAAMIEVSNFLLTSSSSPFNSKGENEEKGEQEEKEELERKKFEERFKLVGFQPDHDTTLKLLIKELYLRRTSVEKVITEEDGIKFSVEHILYGEKEIAHVAKILTIEKKEALMKSLYEILGRIHSEI